MKETIPFIIVFWILLAVFGSFVRVLPEVTTCEKTYPFDYMVYTKLFCEIKK